MDRPPDYAFAFRPVWLAGHVVVLVTVGLFLFLGGWQLSRDDARKEIDAQVTARTEPDPLPLADLVTLYGSTPQELALRRTLVEGEYLSGDEVIWQARTRSGISGHDVLTPLDTGSTTIIIDRGWVPIDIEGPPVVGAEVPRGTVSVTGVILETQQRGRFGPIDPPTGVLGRISRVDIDRLQKQISATLAPFYIQLETQSPGQPNGVPLPQPRPAVGLGPPHFAYAVQWFVFVAVALIGYPILLRRTARKQGRSEERPTSAVLDPVEPSRSAE